MKKMVRYITLLPGWCVNKIKSINHFLIWTISKVLASLYCFLKVIFGYNNLEQPTQELEFFYPNTGSKCKAFSFIYQEPTVDLSIIVPVYNVSDFIDECLQSILSQKIDYSFEIIIVDDGSTDSTYDHLKKYIKYDNVYVFRQSNAGQSAARNYAINHSKGRFLMFVDGDDLLMDESINRLMDAAIDNNCKIAEGRVVNFTDIISEEQINDTQGKNSEILDYEKDPKAFLPFNSYSVAKVYDRKLWENIRYPEGYIFEDVIIKFIVRRNAGKIAYLKDVVYGYRHHAASSSRGGNPLKKLDSIWVLPHILDLCKTNHAPFDDVYYMLCLEHMGILNYVMLTYQNREIQLACFYEVIKQLNSVKEYRIGKMPIFFRLLEKAILDGDFEKWRLTANTIVKYDMLKKWRENN